MYDKRLISRIHRECSQNQIRKRQFSGKMDNRLKQILHKAGYVQKGYRQKKWPVTSLDIR